MLELICSNVLHIITIHLNSTYTSIALVHRQAADCWPAYKGQSEPTFSVQTVATVSKFSEESRLLNSTAIVDMQGQ